MLIRPHGNAKNDRPYRRARESTKLLLKEELSHNSPKVAVNTVFDKRGGLLEAKSAGELPRGRRQAYYNKGKLQQEQVVHGSQDKCRHVRLEICCSLLWHNVRLHRKVTFLYKMSPALLSQWQFCVMSNS